MNPGIGRLSKLTSRPVRFAAALGLALLAQANLLMASLSPCGLPFDHAHFIIGHVSPDALEEHLAAEAACRMGLKPHSPTAPTDAFGRVISEPRSDSLAHTFDNLSMLLDSAAPTVIIILLAASFIASRLSSDRCPESPHPWRPPVPPPRFGSLIVS